MPRYYVVLVIGLPEEGNFKVIASGETIESIQEPLAKSKQFGDQPMLLEAHDFECTTQVTVTLVS